MEVLPLPVKPFHENVLDALTGADTPIVTAESAVEVIRITNLIQEANQ